MAALTGAYDAKRKDGAIIAFLVGAGVIVHKGALVAVTSATGFVGPAADAAGTVFVGVAYESADNSRGAGGAAWVRVQTVGLYRYGKAGAVQSDVGKTAYVVDDNTVGITSAHAVPVGGIMALIDGGMVGVLIEAGGV